MQWRKTHLVEVTVGSIYDGALSIIFEVFIYKTAASLCEWTRTRLQLKFE